MDLVFCWLGSDHFDLSSCRLSETLHRKVNASTNELAFPVHIPYLDEKFLWARFGDIGRTDFDLLPYAW